MFQSYLEDKRNNDMDTIVFLYKLVPGICPKSFGFNVAELAGIPDRVVKFGTNVAFQMETRHNLRQLFFDQFASFVRNTETTDANTVMHALESVAEFEAQVKKDLQDLPKDTKFAGRDWWPSAENDPCQALTKMMEAASVV